LGQKLPHIPKPAQGRLGDILRPLQQIILLVSPDREAKFLSLVSKLEAERAIDLSTSLEAEILTAVMSLEDRVHNGILTVEDICEKFNFKRSERNHINSYRIGRKLSAMGFKRTRTNDGHAAIFYNVDEINRLLNKYGISKTSEMSESSEKSLNEVESTEVSEGSEDL
jgi:hypothetical protein